MKNERNDYSSNKNIEINDGGSSCDSESFQSIELTRKSYEEILAPEAGIPIMQGKEKFIKIKKQQVRT